MYGQGTNDDNDDSLLKMCAELNISKATARNIINDYDLGINPVNINIKYGVKVPVETWSYVLPPKEQPSKCRYCGQIMVMRRSQINTHHFCEFCPKCGHQEIRECRCSGCINVEKRVIKTREDMVKSRQIQIDTKWQIHLSKVVFGDLTDMHKVHLYILLHRGHRLRLYPTEEIETEVNKTLIKYGIVLPLTNKTPLEAFGEAGETVNPDGLVCSMNVDCEEGLENAFEKWKNSLGAESFLQLWQYAAQMDVLTYLLRCFERLGLGIHNPGTGTKEMIAKMLDAYSVCQCRTIIYRTARNIKAFCAKERISRSQARNMVIAGCSKQVTGKDGRQIEPMLWVGSDCQCPASDIVFRDILGIGERGRLNNFGKGLGVK